MPHSRSAGGLLTADGSGDDLIKLEGVPKGKQFSWVDDPLDAPPPATAPPPLPIVPDPEDVGPTRDDTTAQDEDADNMLEEDDDEDEDDAPPAPRVAPEGFRIVEEPPPAATLVPKDPAQQTLVGRSMLYCWPSVGWCVGYIKEANSDRRYKMEGEVVNFYVHYEIDDNVSRRAHTRHLRRRCGRLVGAAGGARVAVEGVPRHRQWGHFLALRRGSRRSRTRFLNAQTS